MTFQQFDRLLKNPFFIIGWFGLAACSYYFFDLKIAVFIHDAAAGRPKFLLDFFEVVTRFGGSGIYLILSAALILWGYFKKNQRLIWAGILIFLAVMISGIVCDVFKIALGRARPVEFFKHHIYGFYFWEFHNTMRSFPSGHATTIAAAATACSFLMPRYWPIFFAAVFLVDASRLILLAHYLSDTMAGSYLGFIVTDYLYQHTRFDKLRQH